MSSRCDAFQIIEIESDERRRVTVSNVRALHATHEADIIEAICQAFLVTTAVGPNVLPAIAPLIAKGLQRRLEAGLTPTYLAIAIAAALQYDNPQDEQAVALAHDLKSNGVDWVLSEVCNLSPDSDLVTLIKEQMRKRLLN